MQLFIDTNILYDDPFWKNSYNKVLLNRIESGRIKLFMSEVVYKELLKNYTKQLNDNFKSIENSVIKLNKKLSLNELVFKIKPVSELIAEFENFYDELFKRNLITTILADNNLLPEVIDRAVWRKKPFTESKTELKDTIIWLSYARFANNMDLKSPYFLTNNTTDFCKTSSENTVSFEVHDDLKADCDKFVVYKTTKDFISEVLEKVEKAKADFDVWIQQNISPKFVRNLLLSDFRSYIEGDVRREIENADIRKIFSIDHFFTGFLSAGVTNWAPECHKLETDILEDCCIISGVQMLEVETEGFEYRGDNEDDKYIYYGSKDIHLNAYFTVTIDLDFKFKDIEITDVEIYSIE